MTSSTSIKNIEIILAIRHLQKMISDKETQAVVRVLKQARNALIKIYAEDDKQELQQILTAIERMSNQRRYKMNKVYSTEKLLSILKEAGYRSYKKINRNTVEYSRLQMHLPTEIGGKTYNSFNDYVNDKIVEYLSDNSIEAFVNNNNQIELYLDDKEQLELNRKLYCLLKEENII